MAGPGLPAQAPLSGRLLKAAGNRRCREMVTLPGLPWQLGVTKPGL